MEQHKKRRRRWPLVLICVVLALVLAVAGVAAYMYSQISAIFDTGEVGSLSQTQDPDIEANGERFYNLLVFGIDYDADDSGRTYAEGKGNTDVILYVQIDRDNRKVNVLQIPRDSWYGETMVGGITGYQCKINEVYANGPDQDHLVNNLANQIYEMYKLPIDNYVYIEMDAFKTMIDVMGGIEMYVPWDIVYIDKDTKEEVLAIMGEPLSDEQFCTPDCWFYYVEPVWCDGLTTEDECIPLVFENGRLVGFGRRFYTEYRLRARNNASEVLPVETAPAKQ